MEQNEGHNQTQQPGVIMQKLADEYLDALAARQYSPKSVATYRRALENFLRYLANRGRLRMQDITGQDLEDYRLALVQREFAPASLELYLRTVRQCLQWLEEKQVLFANPAAGLVIPKPPRKLLPVPTGAQIKKLLAQPDVTTPCGVRDRALLETAYATGARREEMHRLTIFDADLDSQRLRVLGKGKKERVLPLGRHASQWLGRYLREVRPKLLAANLDEPALWVDRHGKQLDYNALQQLFTRHSRDAGLKPAILPHAMRRACATHMLQNGAHPMQLQLLLGHATLKTLSQYLRLTITEIQSTHRASNPGK